MCVQLSTLDLHGTEITADLLRQVYKCLVINEIFLACIYWGDAHLISWQFEGWESFDERRRLKHQKQLDSRVTSSAEFDEGADKSW